MTAVEWLRRPPKRRSLRTMRELHDKYRWLELLVGHYRLSGIPRQRQLDHARRFRRRRAADLGTLSDHRRELEALCFITVTLATITDDLLRLVEMRITAIWRWATRRCSRAGHPTTGSRTGRTADRDPRPGERSDGNRRGVQGPGAGLVQPAAGARRRHGRRCPRGAMPKRRRIRPIVELLTLRLCAERGHARARECLSGCEDRRRRWAAGRTRPPNGTPAVAPWCRNDGQRALRAFEAATLGLVRRSLRNGSLWSPHGWFSDPARNLMPAAVWQNSGAGYRFRRTCLRIPRRTPIASGRLAGALAGLGEPSPTTPCISDTWTSTSRAIRPSACRTDWNSRRVACTAGWTGAVPSPAARARCAGAFQLDPARARAQTCGELLGVYGALLAAGTDLESRGIATMVRGVRESTVRRYMRLFEARPALRAANDALVHFARRHAVVNHWGSGYEASSDLLSLDASKHLWNARWIETPHVRHRHLHHDPGPVGHPVRSATPAAAATGGRRDRRVDASGSRRSRAWPSTPMVTPTSPTESRSCSASTCPRLHDMREQWLHVPKGWPEMPSLEPILKRDVDLEAIHAEYDALLGLAASIDDETTGRPPTCWSGSVPPPRLPATSRRNPARTALAHGVPLRLLGAGAFRRQINRLLVRGESVHQLQRAIHYGPIRAHRGRRREELNVISRRADAP